MRAFLTGLPGAMALLLVPAALPAAAPEGVTSFTLPNGLVGVVIEDHRAPVVTHMVWYKVGGADDPAGQSGLAHFLEHLMFKGTDALAEGEFSRVVAANGGEENAFTTPDYTAYHQRIAADRLDMVMGDGGRPDDGPRPRRGRRAAPSATWSPRSGGSGSGTRPTARSREQMDAALYLNSPYGRPVIGWEQEIAGFTRAAAMAFYRAHYAPNNAILVVAGDVSRPRSSASPTAHFGPIPASPAIAPRRAPAGADAGGGAAGDDAGRRACASPISCGSYLAPGARTGDQAQAAALTVLAELLGGSGVTSVMARELMMGDGIALGVGGRLFQHRRRPAELRHLRGAEARGRPRRGRGAARRAAGAFVAEGPEPAELARLKVQMRASEIYDLDSQQSRAHRIGAALATGLTLDDVAAWPGLLQAVTPADVQAAARRRVPAGGLGHRLADRPRDGGEAVRRLAAALILALGLALPAAGRDRHPDRHLPRRHHRLALRGAFAADRSTSRRASRAGRRSTRRARTAPRA